MYIAHNKFGLHNLSSPPLPYFQNYAFIIYLLCARLFFRVTTPSTTLSTSSIVVG